MFSTRIRRKAVSIFAITLLAAGTAAAAAAARGALPILEDAANEVIVEAGDQADVNVEDGPDNAGNVQPTIDEASPEGTVPAVANHNGDVDHHGKCTAWTNGSAKNATNPSFVELQVAADAAELTIDAYCATVLGTSDTGDEPTSHDRSDDHKSGNGKKALKSGNENSESGNGNGKSESGNGDGNSESGNGNGNSESGNGNGNSESGNGDGKSESGNGNGNGNGNVNGNGNGNSEPGNGNSGNGGGNHGNGHN